ncbi:MAG: Gldg family protein [Treponema sp.]|nr:Gldg family protein [Treponema sp.]
MKKFWNWLKSPKSDFLLFILLLILINIAGNKTYKRWDLTQPKSYSISSASKDIVKNLDQPLSIRVFFDKNLPAQYNAISQYVSDFLEEYKAAANKNFTVTFVDVSKEENVQLARDFGLKQVQIQEIKNNEVGYKQSYMGLVITYGADVQVIDPITTSDGFEYRLTSAISKMIHTADSLAGLKANEKIKVTVYLSEPLKKMRISGIDQVEGIVSAAFKSVNKQAQDRLDYALVAPSSDEAQLISEHYGLRELYYTGADNSRQTALVGVVVEYDDKFETLPLGVEQTIFGTAVYGLDEVESNLNACIQALVSKPTQIGYIMGHQELPLDEEKYAANLDIAIRDSYQLVDIDLSETDIPTGINTIIINGPQMDYYEDELYKIDQFIMRGGNVMFFIDGVNTAGAGAYYNGGPQYSDNVSNLDRLLNKYGVQRNYDMVMDKNCFVNNNSQYGKLNYYWAPLIQKNQMAKNHPITKNLGYVTMLENGSLDVSAAESDPNVKVTVLARSSDQSWRSTDKNMVLNPITIVPPADETKYHSEIMAVLLEGNFNSAFDEAPVMYDEDGNEIETSDMIGSNYMASSKLPGKIFVAGSSYITTYQVFDAQGTTPIAMLIMNAIDYLNGNADLCEMRTKGLSLNTLTIKNAVAAKILQYFNQYGLTVLVAIAGFVVWRIRSRRRIRINRKYNPDDTRTITKEKPEAKKEDK